VRVAQPPQIPLQIVRAACRFPVIGAKGRLRCQAGDPSMVSHSTSLFVETARTSPITSPPDRERERLRRELLRRIIDRETRRQAVRGGPH